MFELVSAVNDTVIEVVTNKTSYHLCNIMTGSGFDKSMFGGLSMAWLGTVVIFFLIAFARKWIGEEMGMSFNMIAACVTGYLGYLLLITFTCSFKWSLVIGILCAGVGGFLLYEMFGGSQSS